MTKRKTHFGEYILAPADASAFGGPRLDGQFGFAMVYFKENVEGLPYRVANEYVCSRLGQLLGLPVPPSALMRIPGRSYGFASLDFDQERESFVPIIPEACVKSDLRLSTGVVLFDI